MVKRWWGRGSGGQPVVVRIAHLSLSRTHPLFLSFLISCTICSSTSEKKGRGNIGLTNKFTLLVATLWDPWCITTRRKKKEAVKLSTSLSVLCLSLFSYCYDSFFFNCFNSIGLKSLLYETPTSADTDVSLSPYGQRYNCRDLPSCRFILFVTITNAIVTLPPPPFSLNLSIPCPFFLLFYLLSFFMERRREERRTATSFILSPPFSLSLSCSEELT